jgi:lauroyl/myristoyl acyltransferase
MSPDDLAAAVLEVERTKAHLLLPAPESLLRQVFHHPALHRAPPLKVALGIGHVRAALTAFGRLQGTAWMQQANLMLGPDASPSSTEALAEQLQRTNMLLNELNWHPELAATMPIEGLEHLHAAQAGGRGVIIATIHLGPILTLVHALSARGQKVYVVGGHRSHEPPTNRAVIFLNQAVEDAGARWVHLGGSYPVLRALLQRGECVLMYVDRADGLLTQLGGRPARVSESAGRLATDVGAAIVPGYGLHLNGSLCGRLLPAVIPGADEGADEVTHRMASAFDEVLNAHPEQAQPTLGLSWAGGLRRP